jgi:hypothetical protein
MSESAHHTRGGFRDSIAAELRQFAYGPHPDPRVRAEYVAFAGHLLDEVVMLVGDSFADILGREYYTTEVRPLLDAVEEVRRTSSIEEDPL